jgi:two-component system sensor kinase FixL
MVENLFNATATTRPGGLSRGISIGVAIVDSHRGKLWLEHSEKGNTDFRFRIPLAAKGETA